MTATTITAADAAARAGVTVDTVRAWCRMGAVRATKTAAGRWAVDVVSLARRITIGRKAPTTKGQPVKVLKPEDIRLDVEDGRAYLTAPYHATANSDYRQIGGKWDGARRAWRFAARDVDHVRAVLHEHFGRDDQPVPVVDVRVNLDHLHYGQSCWFAGRRIAHRPSRDADVRLGDNVIVIRGGFYPSGGSVKYPDLSPRDNTIVEVRDVPAHHADLKEDGVTVITEDNTGPGLDEDTRASLQTEREALQARLAEIDALLGGKG